MAHIHKITFFPIIFTVLSGFMFIQSIRENISVIATTDGVKFSMNDFMIKDFGIDNDGNPFLTVEGNAGATVPQKENTGYTYVFFTDNGTFSVSSDWMYTEWHTHLLTLDEKNCVESMDMDANVGADVRDMVKVTHANATKVDRVITGEFTINNNDGSLCGTKIFDSAP